MLTYAQLCEKGKSISENERKDESKKESEIVDEEDLLYLCPAL